jgi:mono/diheme cytochrome c family protein
VSGVRRLLFVAALAGGLGCIQISVAHAQAPTLTIADRETSKTYAPSTLLADRAAREITIAHDPVYRRSMTYRAIPMADLLKGLKAGDDDYVQARATDDFSIGIPVRLLRSGAGTGIEAFLAVESSTAKWPALPGAGKNDSAGPFYIVWHATNAAGLSSEYWVYHLAAVTITDSPYRRWPGLGIAQDVPAGDPIRRGLERFVAVCMACHRFNGDGEAGQGPDLGRPMNPVEYFQPAALKKLLRNPSSVRSWPELKMPAFDEASLSDADIDAIVAWLAYKNRSRR